MKQAMKLKNKKDKEAPMAFSFPLGLWL